MVFVFCENVTFSISESDNFRFDVSAITFRYESLASSEMSNHNVVSNWHGFDDDFLNKFYKQ